MILDRQVASPASPHRQGSSTCPRRRTSSACPGRRSRSLTTRTCVR